MSSTCSSLLIMIIAILSLFWLNADAYDPEPLQDFCVAVNDSKDSVIVNGKICKDPNTVTADDFTYSGLNRAGNITSPFGTKIQLVFVNEMPGLNTLGISMVRIDFAPGGANPPHVHPHASEILLVQEGTIYAGFISSNPMNPRDENKLYAKVLGPGDVFLFPKGLIHFQYNLGDKHAVAYASLSSQNPGVVTISRPFLDPIHPCCLTFSSGLSSSTPERLIVFFRSNGLGTPN